MEKNKDKLKQIVITSARLGAETGIKGAILFVIALISSHYLFFILKLTLIETATEIDLFKGMIIASSFILLGVILSLLEFNLSSEDILLVQALKVIICGFTFTAVASVIPMLLTIIVMPAESIFLYSCILAAAVCCIFALSLIIFKLSRTVEAQEEFCMISISLGLMAFTILFIPPLIAIAISYLIYQFLKLLFKKQKTANKLLAV